MNTMQQILVVGLLALLLLAIFIIGTRIAKEGVSLRGRNRHWTRTPFDVFAHCIPFRHARIWAAIYFLSFVVFGAMLIMAAQ
jgi:uncharacterized integral membrane protein